VNHKQFQRAPPARPLRAVDGFTALGPNSNSLYFAVAVSTPCELFWASVRLLLAVFETGDLV